MVIDKEVIVVTNAVKKLTVPAAAQSAIIQAQVDGVRFWLDGSVPTAAEGQMLAVNTSIIITCREDLLNFKAFRITNDATVTVQYRNTPGLA